MRIIKLASLCLCIPLGLTVQSASTSSNSLNDAMKECASIQRDLKRLACFDKLSGRVSDFNIETMTEEQRQSRRQTQTTQTQQSAPVAGLSQSAEEAFGIEDKSRPDAELDTITSYIPGKMIGWEKGDQITLANGQIWEIINGRISHSATDARVEISRGIFGSFRMKIVGLNRTSQVKRIQ